MKHRGEKTRVVSDRALEIIMRDVFDGLTEMILETAYEQADPGFKIIDISPDPFHSIQTETSPHIPHEHEAKIIDFPPSKRR